VLGVLFFVAWHGSIWFDTLAIASAVHNFGADRGKVVHRYNTRQCGNALQRVVCDTQRTTSTCNAYNTTRMLVGLPACTPVLLHDVWGGGAGQRHLEIDDGTLRCACAYTACVLRARAKACARCTWARPRVFHCAAMQPQHRIAPLCG
jgi:hypothetical protein